MKYEYCHACESKTPHKRGQCCTCGQSLPEGFKDGEFLLHTSEGYVTCIGWSGIWYSHKREDAFVFPNWESVDDAYDVLPISATIERC